MTVYGARQATFEDYDGFVEKFKPKKTTDDCYTPEPVYEAVKDWAVSEYGLQGREIVRPFYPGGDYESFDYPDGCVVIDNPPFSIISKICRDYVSWGVGFFLFAPTLTNFSTRNGNHVITDACITYANGAKVDTSFITSFGNCIARTAPTLADAIEKAQETDKPPALPKYVYPDNLLTVNDLNKMSKAGIDFRVSSGLYVSVLDAQKPLGKAIFGSGLLISDEDAELKRAELKRAELKRAELKRAERESTTFELSWRERQLIEHLEVLS
jgi:hypothetical protein